MPASSLSTIRLHEISKSFGSVRANRRISLDIHTGKVKALLGENGAGKSTLMSILAGRLQPDSGQIFIDGRPATFHTAKDAIAAGVGMVYQHFMLVEAMTVAENVLLGQSDKFWLNPSHMAANVAKLADGYGLAIDPSATVSSLSMGEKQRVEILKLLYRQSHVLVFDEPTAVLTPREIDQLFDAFRQMKRQGKAIVFISHKLDEVLSVADEIAILRKGCVIDEVLPENVKSRSDLALRMVGKDVLLDVEKNFVEPRQTVLKVEGLENDALTDIHLDIRQGEILGVVGVAGNGQKSLVETVCGLTAPQKGSVKILGQEWHRFFAWKRPEGTLSYIPEDRRGMATCLGLDLTDNFLLTTRHGFSRGPWLLKKKARRKAREMFEGFDVQPAGVNILAKQLSGGNLQKVVLAREFFRRPRFIVAEQPTQGLDIAAIEEVWRLLLKARDRSGILLITGDLAEALTLSDRIAVMFGGRIMDTFSVTDREKIDRIGLLMAGITPDCQRS